MISLDRASYQVQPRYAEYAGLSTDIKPVESINNGDEFQEIDTGFVYKFDETNSEWVKQPTSGGGGAIDDDTISTGTTWSSAKIVETVCPPFEVTGPIVTCNPVAGYPLHVVSQIVPVQEGEGDPSPENVRPISGWTEANLWHGGKNLVSLGDSIESVVSGVILGKNSIRSNINNYYFVCFKIPTTLSNKLRPGMALTLSTYTGVPGKKLTLVVQGYDSNGSAVTTEKSSVSGGNSVTCYVPDNISVMNYVECRFNRDSERFTDTETIIDGIQLEIGDTKTIFQPPTFKNITLPFGQTIYGGELDWTTGVLTVDWATTTFTGEENWYYGKITNMFTTEPESGLPFSTDTPLCNQFIGKRLPTASASRFGVYSQNNNRHAIGYEPAAGDIQAFKDFLRTRYEDGNPVVVAHKTLNVFTIQLTHQEILALSGVNTIYTDTGDTTVSGRADPTTIINQLAARIAALESAATNI